VGKVFAAHSAVEVVEVFKFNVGKVSPFEKTIEATSVFVKYLRGQAPRLHRFVRVARKVGGRTQANLIPLDLPREWGRLELTPEHLAGVREGRSLHHDPIVSVSPRRRRGFSEIPHFHIVSQSALD